MTTVSTSFNASTHPLEGIVPEIEREILDPIIADIERLKVERNAVVIAHNYMTPDIFHTVADIRGDSLALAQEGARTEAEVIVMAGVHFMAETAKVLSADKTVLIPDLRAGCSLASSITAADVRSLRDRKRAHDLSSGFRKLERITDACDDSCIFQNLARVRVTMHSRLGQFVLR